MDQQALNIINACFGIIKTGQEMKEETRAKLLKAYQDFSAKGAADMSESSVRVRDLADKFVTGLEELVHTAEKDYDDIKLKVLEVQDQVFAWMKGEHRKDYSI
ncbi:hypothetical protein CH373_06605 [Leptospira perolatii]|uniref:Chemotaxis protein n=1 Tax=Leptospira perolatii TaxID=2023191 RepID=A0A2M9ZP65_9LEPT|nr:chemotaxis protein [Leptospira perolatii]PJZ70612.1 hypothetical protein CH360_03465 [Leptospira perolatii]PJZ73824.1 hypothetical protein CH373_06605 [Leptospira perolatii]